MQEIQERGGFDPWVRRIPWEEGMATHSNIFAWRIPCTEWPGRLWSIGSQRVWYDWCDWVLTQAKVDELPCVCGILSSSPLFFFFFKLRMLFVWFPTMSLSLHDLKSQPPREWISLPSGSFHIHLWISYIGLVLNSPLNYEPWEFFFYLLASIDTH